MSGFDFRRDPVFGRFQPWRGFVAAGFHPNFLGQMTDVSFVAGWADEERMKDRQATLGYPGISEETFEWQLLLSAVLEARGQFVMVEVGAGFGRWLVSSVCALRCARPEIPFRLVAIEAEPQHFAWIGKHFRDNGIDPAAHRLIQAAVSGHDGHELFMIGHSEQWYGQNIVAGSAERRSGFPDARATRVDCLSVPTVLADLGRVDLMDFDIQGAERTAIPVGIEAMTRQVKRVFVETHGSDIHQIVELCFRSHGWQCAAKFGFSGRCISEAEMIWEEATEFGTLRLSGGGQCWINPMID